MAKTVLIVEDNELNMKLFHDLLEAHGYQTVVPEARVAPLPGVGTPPPEFWVATFAQGSAPVPVHLRVFWCWKDAGGWRAPDNPGRAFRAGRTGGAGDGHGHVNIEQSGVGHRVTCRRIVIIPNASVSSRSAHSQSQ